MLTNVEQQMMGDQRGAGVRDLGYAVKLAMLLSGYVDPEIDWQTDGTIANHKKGWVYLDHDEGGLLINDGIVQAEIECMHGFVPVEVTVFYEDEKRLRYSVMSMAVTLIGCHEPSPGDEHSLMV